MRDAIVEIAALEKGRLGARLLHSTVEYPDALNYFVIDLDPATLPTLDTCDNVEAYGTKLRGALFGHSAIESELTQIFLTAQPDRAMLQFLIAPADAERFRWETLCKSPPAQFLALNEFCTVSRIAHAAAAKNPGVRAFSFPLRMAAFLSAAQVTAELEFKEICERVAEARAKGLGIQCTVYLGEQDLLDAAEANIAAGTLPGIAVAGMPSNSLAIEDTLKEHPAEFLHFFCHGVMDAGVRLLELATISDQDTGKNTGSVSLSIERLTQVLLTTGTTWITVLNSCSGAKPAGQLHSMALALAKMASPFAVGMAEPIDAADATIFSKAFYKELFAIVQTGVANLHIGESVTLDLAPAVARARKLFHSQYATTPAHAFGRWCVPLMYQRNAPLQVLAIDPVLKRKIELVAGALRSLPEDAPDDLRTAILSTLDKAGAPANLRPNRYGIIGSQ